MDRVHGLLFFLIGFYLIQGCKSPEQPGSVAESLYVLRKAYVEEYGATHNLMHFANYIAESAPDESRQPELGFLFLQEIMANKQGWEAVREDPLEYFVKDFEIFYQDHFSTSPLMDSVSQLLSTHFIEADPRFAFNLQLQDLAGNKVMLKDFRGKSVVLDFWATWCVPCIQQMPYLEMIKEEFKDEEVVFLTVNMDDDPEKWKSFVTKKNPQHEVTTRLPAGNEDRQATVIGVNTLPAYLFVNREGKLVCSDGPKPKSRTFSALITYLLKES